MQKEKPISDLVYENLEEAVVVVGPDTTIVSVNPAFTALTGYSQQEVVGQKSTILKSKLQDDRFYEQLWNTVVEKGHWEGEIWNRRKDGGSYLEHVTIRSIVDDESGQIRYCIGMLDDVTERNRREESFKDQAYHDPLTGLPNRSLLQERLNALLQQKHNRQQPFAILFLDLDRFKAVNDTYGHAIGDLLLKTVAQRLTACTRAGDTIARLGGDEFVVLLPGVDGDRPVIQAAQKIIRALSEPCLLDGHPLTVSTSVGIALSGQANATADQWIQMADAAMYHAKRQGLNRYEFYKAGHTKQTAT